MAETLRITPYEQRLPNPRSENPNKLKDPIAQTIVDKWWTLGGGTPAGIRDQVGLIYISHFLGLGEDVAQKFSEGDALAEVQVGLRQSSIPPTDSKAFWEEIQNLLPEMHTQKEIEYLTDKTDNRNGVLRFMWTFEDPFSEPSVVLNALTTNAIAYK